MNLIELSNVSFTYQDGTQALKDISLSIGKGRKIAVLGPNGSGKSTLFLLLNGINRLDAGSYYYDGEKISYTSKQKRLLIKNVGLVFQDPDIQLFASTVFQEISIGPKNIGCSDDDTRTRINSAMELTDTTVLAERPPHFLSYGEKKRVALADILAMEPEVIVLDEPLAWLDSIHEKGVLGILDQLHQNGKTVVMSTHSSDIAYEWADYIYVLKDGMVIGEGTPAQLFEDAKMLAQGGIIVPYVLQVAAKLTLKRMPVNREDLLSLLGEQ